MACAACPTPGHCYGATGQIPGLCEWAARGDHWLDRVARRNALPAPGELPPPSAAPPPSPDRPSIRAQHAANATARSCPYRDDRCGCDFPTCHAGRGDHDGGSKASRERCLSCLKSTWSLT